MFYALDLNCRFTEISTLSSSILKLSKFLLCSEKVLAINFLHQYVINGVYRSRHWGRRKRERERMFLHQYLCLCSCSFWCDRCFPGEAFCRLVWKCWCKERWIWSSRCRMSESCLRPVGTIRDLLSVTRETKVSKTNIKYSIKITFKETKK